MKHDTELNNISTSDWFYMGVSITVQMADVSGFKEDEIRCLYPENPTTLPNIKEWDGILMKDKTPIHGDLGINKKREVFWYYNGWKSIK